MNKSIHGDTAAPLRGYCYTTSAAAAAAAAAAVTSHAPAARKARCLRGLTTSNVSEA